MSGGPVANFASPPSPPQQGVQWEGDLVGLVARVGAHRGRLWVIPGSPPRMGNAWGTLKEACTRFPPLMGGVCEERGGACPVRGPGWALARTWSRGVPLGGWGCADNFLSGSLLGMLGYPGPREKFARGPPLGWGYIIF